MEQAQQHASQERPLKNIHASRWADDDLDEYRHQAEEAEKARKEVITATRAAKGGPAQSQPAAKPTAADAETAIKKKTRRGRRNRKPAGERSLARQEHQGTQPARQ